MIPFRYQDFLMPPLFLDPARVGPARPDSVGAMPPGFARAAAAATVAPSVAVARPRPQTLDPSTTSMVEAENVRRTYARMQEIARRIVTTINGLNAGDYRLLDGADVLIHDARDLSMYAMTKPGLSFAFASFDRLRQGLELAVVAARRRYRPMTDLRWRLR